MGLSMETRVRVHAIHNDEWRKYPELEYIPHEEYPESVSESPLSKKAYKVLKDAEPGDFVEVVWDFDSENPSYFYPIVEARIITGSLEERVDELEKKIAELEEKLS